MKRYYSETIPVELGVKLQDVGMKVEWRDNTPIDYPLVPDWGCLTTFAEAIDWLIEQGVIICIVPTIHPNMHKVGEFITEWTGYCEGESIGEGRIGWCRAAEETIETALKMLKEKKK